MRDNLEKFIHQNRDQFDQKIPNLKVWSDIEKRLDPPRVKRIPLLKKLGVAASIVFLLGMGALLGRQFFSKTITTNPVEIATDFQEFEIDFQKRINQQKARLASYNYDESINEDLNDLDETLAELREELKDVPKGSEEQIIQAMIKNYETKVKILEIVLDKIDSYNSKNRGGNESSEM